MNCDRKGVRMKITFFGMTPWEKEQLEQMDFGVEAEYAYIDDVLNQETIAQVEGSQAVSILSNSVIDEQMAAKLKNMGVSFVTNRGTGVDHIDAKAIAAQGMDAANVPGYSPESISENTILLLLSLLRKMKRNQSMIRSCNYKVDGIRGKVLRNMTVGVLGSGKIGAITIQILAGFGCKVLVNDVYEKEEVKKYATYVSREELFANADAVILHCPLLESTYHLINKETLSLFKDGAILVNTARGGLMDAEAVLEALRSGKLSAMAFDVYEGEDDIVRKDFKGVYPPDPVFRELCEREDVIYTAHISFFTDEAAKEMIKISTENVVEYFAKGSCRNSIVKRQA